MSDAISLSAAPVYEKYEKANNVFNNAILEKEMDLIICYFGKVLRKDIGDDLGTTRRVDWSQIPKSETGTLNHWLLHCLLGPHLELLVYFTMSQVHPAVAPAQRGMTETQPRIIWNLDMVGVPFTIIASANQRSP